MNLNITLIGEMITFAVFVWLTMKFVWPPIVKAMDERKQKIADGLAAAERGEHSLELARQKSTEILSTAKGQMGEMIDQAQKQANQIVDKAKGEGQAERKRLIDTAQIEINRQTEAARDSLQAEIVDLVMTGAEKLLQQKLNKPAHDKILQELIQEI